MVAQYGPDFDDPIQEVRHLIGDVDYEDPRLSDLEIAYELGAAGNVARHAAIGCCRALMARFAQVVTTSNGDVRVQASDLFAHYRTLMAALASPTTTGLPSGAVPYAGGLDRAPLFTRARPGTASVDRSFLDADSAYVRRYGGA
jgi:hypothetical protein